MIPILGLLVLQPGHLGVGEGDKTNRMCVSFACVRACVRHTLKQPKPRGTGGGIRKATQPSHLFPHVLHLRQQLVAAAHLGHVALVALVLLAQPPQAALHRLHRLQSGAVHNFTWCVGVAAVGWVVEGVNSPLPRVVSVNHHTRARSRTRHTHVHTSNTNDRD